jgi:uncharacterized protein (DUF302 family)
MTRPRNGAACAVIAAVALAAAPAAPAQDPPLVEIPSRFPAAETADRLEAAIRARGLLVFARIDHGANARAAGLELAPTVLVVTGDPAAGTRLMHCDQRVAADLPLRILVREDAAGVVRIGYADQRSLAARYQLAPCQAVLDRMAAALAALARDAAGHP